MDNKFFIICCILLSACQIGEEYVPQNIMPDTVLQQRLGINPSDNVISETWYTIFEDDDLNTLLKTALTDNFSIKQSIEQLRQSRYLLAINSTKMLPNLDINGEYTYNKEHSPSAYATDMNIFKIGFDAIWEFDIWGKGHYLTDQYYELMKKSAYSLGQVKAVVVAEVISNYINFRAAQEKLRLTKKNLQLQKDLLQIIADKRNAGVADDLAFEQASYVVELTSAEIPQLLIKIEAYKNALSVLLGQSSGKLPIDVKYKEPNITSKPFKYNVQKLYSLPLDIIRTRPDISAAEASIRSQNAVLNQSIIDLYPSINLKASFGYIVPSGHNIFDKKNQSYGYNPQLSLPVWNWNQLKNNIELQKHLKEEYIAYYSEAVLTAVSELENSIVSLEKDYIANKHKAQAVAKTKNIFELTLDKYRNGLVNFKDVADAEQNLLQAQTTLIDSNAQILQDIIAFYKATGGGYNVKECK